MILGHDISEMLTKEAGAYSKSVLSALFELGLSPKLKGFGYTLEAILVYRQDPRQSIMKDIYPAVARLQSPGASPAQVERNIRWAVGLAWKNRDEAVWAKYFCDPHNICQRKPTNLEFISRIAWRIESWGAEPSHVKNHAENTDIDR